MTFSCTIDGNARDIRYGSMAIELVANDRARLTCDVLSSNGSWRPDLDEEIVLVADSVTIFGGYIESCMEGGAGGTPTTAIGTTIKAIDYNGIPDRKLLAEARPSETTLARLTWLVNNHLDDYGVSLHGSQVTGATLEARAYAYESAAVALREIAEQNGPEWIWRIDFSKVLRVYSSAGVSAPFNIASGDGNTWGDITVEPSRAGYANQVVVQYGAPGTAMKTDVFTGDGSTTAWTLTYPIVTNPWPGVVLVNGVDNETLGLSGDGAQWTLNPTYPATITRTSAVTTGHSIELSYLAQFPNWVIADGGPAAGDVQMVKIDRPDLYDKDAAQAVADAELAIREVTTRTVRYMSRVAGLLPGMSQDIVISQRGLNDTGVITEVVITNDAGPNYLNYAVTVVVAGGLRTWRDTYRNLSGASSSLGGGQLVVTQATGSWDGQVPAGGVAGWGMSGFASSPSAMTFDRNSTNAWGVAVNTDGLADFLGIANKTLGDWILKIYELTGAVYLASASGGSIPLNLGYPGTGTEINDIYTTRIYVPRLGIHEGTQSDSDPALDEWVTYSPSLVSVGGSPSIGTGGTLTGRYARSGNVVKFAFELTLGTSFSFGTGNVGITLPATASASNRDQMDAFAIDTGTAGYPLIATRSSIGGAQVCGIYQWASPLAAITTTVPFTFASGDVISGAGWFEV